SSGIRHHFIELESGFDNTPARFRKAKEAFEQADIIHIHSYNRLLAKAAVASKKKIVFSEHGNFGFGRKKTPGDLITIYLLKRFLNKHAAFISFNSKFTEKFAKDRY